MPASDFDELKTSLSPSNKVKWIVLKWLERLVKTCAKNAPAPKAGRLTDAVPVKVDQSDSKGAELSVDVIAIMEKYGLKTFDVCEDGEPVQYDIPARLSGGTE